ncbi:hypothetical protein VP01_1362g4 [Puccinia sorghi]|uniref:Uncharacterized protein n=1 Tax=Puccinia sorghi TaxID=27349 RepID=A0A0L6VLV0_9BASI|nr:hypothetical protein VP01_1362g4 [Puccinia sorghi]
MKLSNNLITNGLVAFDSGLNQQVLVMTAVLCFLGDSPMHAEITNTPNPGVSLNPCRICTLQVSTLADKPSETYVMQCVGLNSLGERVESNLRKWSETISRSHELWEIATNQTKNAYTSASKKYGIQDNINNVFINQWKTRNKEKIDKIRSLIENGNVEKICNPFLRLKGEVSSLILIGGLFINVKTDMVMQFILGFDGCKDTPVEVLHVFLLGAIKYMIRDFMIRLKAKDLSQLIASWESFNKESLDLAELNGKYFVRHFKSLVGKHFKKAIQMIPFVFYQFMDSAERELWSSLCHLAPYVYQTSIINLEDYLQELSQKIDIFLHHVIKMSAKWVNKPKFHMLIHLPHSIRRFGPASLFATEKFESYNSILRKASVHSNRHRPGRDLAITFANYECMRAVLSGATLYNNDTKSYFQPSSNITDMFQAPIIQQSMGYNEDIDTLKIYPHQTHRKLDSASKLPTPKELQDIYPTKNIKQIHSLIIDPKNTVKRKTFVQMLTLQKLTLSMSISYQMEDSNGKNMFVCQINSIWAIESRLSTEYEVELTQMKPAGVSPFYHMMQYVTTDKIEITHAKYIKTTLNLQHNCHEGQCRKKMSKKNADHNHEGPQVEYLIEHTQLNSYILNTASFHSPCQHREMANIITPCPTAEERISAVVDGAQKWKAEVNILPPPKEIIPQPIEDGSISNSSDTSSMAFPGSIHDKSEASEIISLVSDIYLNSKLAASNQI